MNTATIGSTSATADVAASASWYSNRWIQLLLGIVCMSMIANLQYGWTLFVEPMSQAHGWGRAAIQIAFTIFIVTETWLVPVEGWIVDRIGPRKMVFVAGALCAVAWVINSKAESLAMLYFGAVVGGIGAGSVYGTCMGNAVKWFGDKRGLAAGLTAAGFGAGSALTIIPIANMIKADGYQAAFFNFGLFQGLVVMIAALLLIKPPASSKEVVKSTTLLQGSRDFSLGEVVRQPLFWLMYLMFVSVASGGLLATAQLGSIAKDFGLDGAPVSMLGLTLPALTFALAIDRVLNGLTRPFFGWVSDMIGREITMLIAFMIEGIGIIALLHYGHNPVAFVILTGLVFFAWGEIYSLFPSICTDTFGAKHASANAGMLYTAKGTAALLVPIGAVIVTSHGWAPVFYIAAALNIAAALAAWFILKPWRERFLARVASSIR
ncbi:oxalate/formate MFS antiporter [Piscinibacter sakaiensis]|uniref:oxalate/formate MFS antiporter n=1 Tax=Piscinibacter sakaiensis TaxID=1547922 RepID=UPI003AAE7C69